MNRQNTRYSTAEMLAIENGRKKFPDTPQRALAHYLYLRFRLGESGHSLAERSRASIYAAIRRYDAAHRTGPRAAKTHPADKRCVDPAHRGRNATA